MKCKNQHFLLFQCSLRSWPLGGNEEDAGRKWWALLLTSTTLFYSPMAWWDAGFVHHVLINCPSGFS